MIYKIKIKTRKSALKRIKIKKKIFFRKTAYKNHLLKNKSNKRLRFLSIIKKINKFDKFVFFKMLPYFYYNKR
jgi:ribosomal protein L35